MSKEKRTELIAAVDAGTTGTRCCIVDEKGTILSKGYCPMKTYYQNPGLAEQDPSMIVEMTSRAVEEAIGNGIDPGQVIGLSITVQRNSFACLAEDGSFLSRLITWQDQRGEQVHPWMRERLSAAGMSEEALYAINGQPFGSFQCGNKAIWLRHFREELYRKTWKLVTPMAILAHAFGAEDYPEENSNLSFWLMADADRQQIDTELCRLFDFNPGKFPHAVDPGTKVGTVSAAASKCCGLREGTPIYLASGDQNCGALGAGNFGTPDLISVCLGTAGLCIAYSPAPVRHPRGMCQVQGHPAGGYLMETHSGSCMSSYRWVGEMLHSNEENITRAMEELASQAPPGANGVFFLPYLQGASCPHYNDAARGAFIGMSMASRKSDMARAAIEGICFENRMMLETLWEAVPHAKTLRLVGGASNSDLWNRIQASVYGLPVETLMEKESTALGAAIICAVSSGLYPDYRTAAENMVHVQNRFLPDEEASSAYDELYGIWDKCYRDLSGGEGFDAIFRYQTKHG